MQYRSATPADAPLLAEMNQRLIHDEGHRNPMSVAELQARMEGWLTGEYQAVVFEAAAGPLGYALFRREQDYVYLRQMFVAGEHRRKGVGCAAIAWLVEHAWQDCPRIRVDVLVGNRPAIKFWRAVGFADYSLALERPL